MMKFRPLDRSCRPTITVQSRKSYRLPKFIKPLLGRRRFKQSKREKNIEDIKVGDKVLSKDEETGELANKEVTATFNHETDEIYQIQGWMFVKDLKVGDLLVQSDGNTLKIDSIELEHRTVTVYNIRLMSSILTL